MTTETVSTVDRLFAEQARRTPDASAARAAGATLSFSAMDESAWRLADRLAGRGIGPGTRVGVAVDPGLARGVTLLAALRSGAAYVPLDPEYPRARLRFMVADAELDLVVVSPRHAQAFEEIASVLPVAEDVGGDALLGGRAHAGEARDAAAPGRTSHARPDLPAYLIYTSGSTGRPKGVVMPHRALTNLIEWQVEEVDGRQPLRTLQFTALSFDVHFQEMFATWCGGGEIVYADEVARRDAARLLALIRDEEVQRLFLPFIALQQLADLATSYGPVPGGLLEVVTAGEQLVVGPALRELFTRLPRCRLHNQYGPSETHVVTSHTLEGPPAEWPTLPPIGRPIRDVRIELLDSASAGVTDRDEGEIFVGGVCVADGYWRREELDAERFVESQAGDRLYRTGDLARRDPDGVLHFLGRADRQLKVRGYRVEPGEVEAELVRHPEVADAVVAPHDSAEGTRLLAYLVLKAPGPGDPRASNEELAAKLDEWRDVWEGTYAPDAEGGDELDLRGWVSSFTGEPIPREEMRCWVEGTVEAVAAHRPDRILEVGCGTGMLLERLAPTCSRYVGMDFSASAIDQLRRRLEDGGRAASVELVVGAAHEIESVGGGFDLILINSVTQHFPGLPYLLRVLQAGVTALDGDGTVFVGDVTSRPLREAFFAAVEAHRAPDSEALDDLCARIRRRLAHDEELAIDPAFFWRLGEWIPQITACDVSLKPGRYDNELSAFRYDVTVRVGGGAHDRPAEVEWEAWNAAAHRPPALRERFATREGSGAGIGVRGVPNRRVAGAFAALGRLSDRGSGTVGEWRREAPEAPTGRGRSTAAGGGAEPFDPEDFRAIGEELGLTVRVAPSAVPDRFDVAFLAPGEAARFVAPPQVDDDRPLVHLANYPLGVALMPRVAAELRTRLGEELPDHMIPDRVMLLAELPRTPSGKVDRDALPPPDRSRPPLPHDEVPPRGETELALAAIWREMLDLESVGVTDNFFDLGGNSLLSVRMGLLIRRRLDREVPIATLFEHPTIRSLATFLDADASAERGAEESRSRGERQREALIRRRRGG